MPIIGEQTVLPLRIYVVCFQSISRFLRWSLFFLQSLALPVSSMSKITQIADIVKTGRGDLVSRTPWLVFAATSAARFYTVLVETADTEWFAMRPCPSTTDKTAY